MKDPNCTPCQEWALCPFHPADEPPPTVRDPLSVDGLKRAADSRPDIRQALVKAGHCAATERPITPGFLSGVPIEVPL